MVNDLFELSRLQTRDRPFDIQTVDIQRILYDQQDKYEPIAKEKSIEVVIRKSNATVLARGNIDRICQVMTILIDNALKFAKSHSVIVLSTAVREDKVVVNVHNTGSYISEEERTHIFDRFYKGQNYHGQQGAGLGLSIAEEVVARMEGKVYVWSDGRNETTFSFELNGV